MITTTIAPTFLLPGQRQYSGPLPAAAQLSKATATIVTLIMTLLWAAAAAGAQAATHSCSTAGHSAGTHGYFASIEQAVAAAADRFNPYSIRDDREYMGVVLRHKHAAATTGFTYTVTAGDAGKDSITLKLLLPRDYEIVAFWHTHGAEHWSRKYFSDTDTRLAKRWGVPIYLADFSGILRVYQPGARTLSRNRANNLGLGRRNGYAIGRVVKHPHSGEVVRVSTRVVSGEALLAGGLFGPQAQQCGTERERADLV